MLNFLISPLLAMHASVDNAIHEIIRLVDEDELSIAIQAIEEAAANEIIISPAVLYWLERYTETFWTRK